MPLELGKLLPEDVDRDVAYIACMPVIAKETLMPGQAVTKDGTTTGKYVGVVDPFLTVIVKPGDRFLLLLNPVHVTSFRAMWESDVFPSGVATAAEREAATRWLTAYAARIAIDQGTGFTYADLMSVCTEYANNGNTKNLPNYWEYDGTLDKEIPDMWKQFRIVTGFGPTDPDSMNAPFET